MMLLGKQTLAGARQSGGYINGVWVAGAGTVFSLSASVQPITGSDLQALPEGRRDKTAYKIFTNTLLQTANDGLGVSADILTINSVSCEVIACQPWSNCSLAHYSATAVAL